MEIKTVVEGKRGCGYAWAAGYYEGEGSISATLNCNGWAKVQLSITSVDREPLYRFLKIVGFGKIYGPYRRHRVTLQQYQWRGHGFKNAQRLRERLAPWLSSRRLQQLDKAIAATPRYQKKCI